MNKSNRSCIEHLPDELWLILFSYISPFDLYYSWRNLNIRINQIVRSTEMRINIKNENEINGDYNMILKDFAFQIISLKDQRCNFPTSEKDSSIDLSSLINIHSLYLTFCSQNQYDQIVNYNWLVRLSLPCDNLSQQFVQQFVLTKEGQEQFPLLKSIGRIWYDDLQRCISLSSISNPMIQHLQILVQCSQKTMDFLQYFPQLKSITIDNFGDKNFLWSSCLIIAKIRRQSADHINKLTLSTIPINTHHLVIHFYGHCDFTELARFLKRCSILKHLQIQVEYYPNKPDLTSIRSLSPFLANLTFGQVHKETGKPMIVAKWPF